MWDSDSFSIDSFSTDSWLFPDTGAELNTDWLLRTRRRRR